VYTRAQIYIMYRNLYLCVPTAAIVWCLNFEIDCYYIRYTTFSPKAWVSGVGYRLIYPTIINLLNIADLFISPSRKLKLKVPNIRPESIIIIIIIIRILTYYYIPMYLYTHVYIYLTIINYHFIFDSDIKYYMDI